MATIAYLRMSTEAQSLDRQRDMMRAIQPDKVFEEQLSGSNADRPQLHAMLAYVREGDTLHIESISRLARNTRDLLHIVDQLQRKGVSLVSHKEALDTSTPTGRFVLTMFAALSELERETTLERAREGIASARARGVRFGRPRVEPPAAFPQTVAEWRAGSITAAEAMRRLGMPKTTFYRLVRAG